MRVYLIRRADGPCDSSAQTLTITVTVPSGSPAPAVLVGPTITPLEGSGGTMRLELRWDSCAPGSSPLLVLAVFVDGSSASTRIVKSVAVRGR